MPLSSEASCYFDELQKNAHQPIEMDFDDTGDELLEFDGSLVHAGTLLGRESRSAYALILKGSESSQMHRIRVIKHCRIPTRMNRSEMIANLVPVNK